MERSPRFADEEEPEEYIEYKTPGIELVNGEFDPLELQRLRDNNKHLIDSFNWGYVVYEIVENDT